MTKLQSSTIVFCRRKEQEDNKASRSVPHDYGDPVVAFAGAKFNSLDSSGSRFGTYDRVR